MTFKLACGDVMPGCEARFENADRDVLMREVAGPRWLGARHHRAHPRRGPGPWRSKIAVADRLSSP